MVLLRARETMLFGSDLQEAEDAKKEEMCRGEELSRFADIVP